MDVICVGKGATVQGQTIDISRSGMLVTAVDGSLPPVGAAELVPFAFLVAVAFADGMKVILGPDVTVRADVLRVTTNPSDRGFLRLGVRFRRALTRTQCAQIGIDESNISDPSLELLPEMEYGLLASEAIDEPMAGDGSADGERYDA